MDLQERQPMRIQVMSDLHLETPRFLPMYVDFQIRPTSSSLALLGDIGNISDAPLFEFLEHQLHQFEIVFFVLGNHEPYSTLHQQDLDAHERWNLNGRDTAIARMQKFEEEIDRRRAASEPESGTMGRFVLMNRRRFDLSETVTVLGCTLFSQIVESQMASVSLFVSDFSNIANWSVDSHNAAHVTDLAWLNAEVEKIASEEPQRQILVLTHYSPTSLAEANDPEHADDSRGVQSAFVTDLRGETCWTSSAVKVWAFGHTHHNCDFVDPSTKRRVVANQRGYGREDLYDFDGEKVIVIGE